MATELQFCLDKSIEGIKTLQTSALKDALGKELLFNKGKWTSEACKGLLARLSRCILDAEHTLEICSQFKPLILHLLCNAADYVKDDNVLHTKFCVALCKIAFVYPQSIAFVVSYLSANKIFYTAEQISYEPAKKKSKKDKSSKKTAITDLELCEACYILLSVSPERFSSVYDWSNLASYLKSKCASTKWYAVQSICLANGIAGEDKQRLLDKYFSKAEQTKFHFQQLLLERGLRTSCHRDHPDLISAVGEPGNCVITNRDLHHGLVSVCGILLPKLTSESHESTAAVRIVVVQSVISALQHVSLAVSSGDPVLLSGHIGAGKTCLIEHLAQLTGRQNQLIKVQLGEQIDNKALLGTYCCTETPGQFVWRPGPLTTAVQNGQWLLLEDIDIAPMDVISSLLSLVETGMLQSSNQGHSSKAKPGFQLFMTKRLHTAGGIAAHSNCSLLEKAVTTVTVQPLSRTELSTVLNTLYPNLTKVVDKLLDMYFTLSSGKHTDDRPDIADNEMVRLTRFYGNRKLSTRDLLRWCARISNDFQLISTDNEISVFQEALDCFCDGLTRPQQRLKLAEAIGTKINVSAEKAHYFCQVYKPSVELTKEKMTVGRASLDRKSISAANSLIRDTHSRFAFTRQSSALLEKICICVNHEEPVLLVGETGTGKTSVVQYLAEQTGRTLSVINMNQQSDSSDLLGGYKPVMISRIISPLREEFEVLFCKSFSRKQNQAFLSHVQQCYASKRWADLLKLIEHTVKAALSKTLNLDKWELLQNRLNTVKLQVKYAESALAFSFVEGALVKALKEGDWVLLDEINLATAETLDCLCGLLDTSYGSVTLIERGDTEPVTRHPDFRLFACMNPATDVGKKDLTAGVRSRFTEFFVDELESKTDLRIMVNAYLGGLSLEPKQIDGVVNFYLAIKQEAALRLTDGTGKRPTYSLRTLCRALRYAASNPYQSVQRSLYEAFSMSFLTQVDRSSHPAVTKLIVQHLLGKAKAKAILSKPLLPPLGVDSEKFEGYWLKRGNNEPIKDENYILTDTVKANMRDVARVVACGRHPVLLQGETSVGKTSMIEYIAKASGNKCVRINNHEHTDVQEYTGSYVADESGHLVFKEGILIDAMRHGYWIILDELNLAPTDVLEALNRLLDDNRELFIAETQQTVRAHPDFILFATQNPPGLYGGRKMLSRAFRNRFVELHFDEIPNAELEYILHKRCALPLSSSKRIVKVMSELQLRRRDSGLFAGKQGYITLRDVFRWGERYRQASAGITDTFYDWDQLLADQGFMLLAGRVRKPQEELVIAQVLEKHFKRKLDPMELFSRRSEYGKESLDQIKTEDGRGMFGHIVWTYSLTRLAVLVGQAMKYNEPVLMVGDTGCGKTTICQYFAHIHQRELYTVNCHMHTEGSHFLGGLRPVRHGDAETEMETESGERSGGKLFEWQDGPLIISMRAGGVLLIDEISLADDSVLERLNSVLEPSRTLVLAEKGGELETISAEPNFRIVATMNPSGDYGKKELSPALRNRFTELWCPQTKNLNDYKLIIRHNISSGLQLHKSVAGVEASQTVAYEEALVEFLEWFHNQDFARRLTISVRDILAWVNFINKCLSGVGSPAYEKASAEMYLHGACLVFLDALGSANIADSEAARERCIKFLHTQTGAYLFTSATHQLEVDDRNFTISPFSIPQGGGDRLLSNYTLRAPSTLVNCLRLLRGLQLHKPILLEGSPGVGKTSLVTALARASGHHIVRINLSQQTDIADLFGADLPVEGGAGGQFTWRDGLFLQALKSGHWIVLDELNLASQSVLEGLNACFDHRAEVYVPELGKTFHIQHDKVKIFACQNPLKQGGGRQGLPQSFLNRFTQVYVNEMEIADQEFITNSIYPDIPESLIKQMVTITRQMVKQRLPGEYNLRDIFRWCDLIVKYQIKGSYNLSEHFSLLFIQPLRSSKVHCEKAYAIFESVTGTVARNDISTVRQFQLTDSYLMVGNMMMKRRSYQPFSHSQACVLHRQLPALEYLMACMDIGWMAILDGPECSGKSTLAHMLSMLVGEELRVFSMNSAMDTTDLLGGFEQADVMRSVEKLTRRVTAHLTPCIGSVLLKSPASCTQLVSQLSKIKNESGLRGKLELLDTVIRLAERAHLAPADALCDWRDRLSDIRLKSTDSSSANGSFVWQDSILVEAVTHGHWLLIENAHICSASVLDRLNSLLEPNGTLTITERGVIDGQSVVIRPHANFRLILTTNTQQSDLSRAMKNRGVIISTHTSPQPQVSFSVDDERLYAMIGVTRELLDVLRQEHNALWDGRLSVGAAQAMFDRAKLLLSYHRRGFDLSQSLQASRRFYLYYSDRNSKDEEVQYVADSGGVAAEHIWTIDRMSQSPSLAMLEQLCTYLKSAVSQLESPVSPSLLSTVLLEWCGAKQLALLQRLPLISDILSESQHKQAIQITASAGGLLSTIQQRGLELSGAAVFDGLPVDARWLPDLWSKSPQTDVKRSLSCLLNVWNTLLQSEQLRADVYDLPANSWSALSERVHQGTLDVKHLPHRVAFFYKPLSEGVPGLIDMIGSAVHDAESFTDQHLTLMLDGFEFLRRFLRSSSIVSATLAWSWLEPIIKQITALNSHKGLSTVASRIGALLEESNTESRLFNVIWSSFPHASPINCEITPEFGGDKTQLATLLQKVLDSLCVYSKADTVERQNLIRFLSEMDMSDVVGMFAKYVEVLHSENQGELVAGCICDLSQLAPRNETIVEVPAYMPSLWPIRELWLLRSLLVYMSNGETMGERQDLLQCISRYSARNSPALLQLSVQLDLLSRHNSSQALLLNVMSHWFFSMTNSSAFRQGQPFIQQLDDETLQKQGNPCFGSTSVFLILSSLLSDDLSTSNKHKHVPSDTDGEAELHSPHSLSPAVCVGRYKRKLSQLNTISREIWRHAALLDCADVRSDEQQFQDLYETILLQSENLTEEFKVHPALAPAIEELNMKEPHSGGNTETLQAERWVWLGFVQAVSTAPRGVLDPVVKGITELQFVSNQSRLADLESRQSELMERSVHRPANEQFLALASESKALLSNLLHYANLQKLVTGLRSEGHRKYLAQEQLVTATLENCIHKLENGYPLYIDCYQPHVNGLKLICYGLRRFAYIIRQLKADDERLNADTRKLTYPTHWNDESYDPWLAVVDAFSSPGRLLHEPDNCSMGLEALMEACTAHTTLTSNQMRSITSQYLRLYVSCMKNHAANHSSLTYLSRNLIYDMMKCYIERWQEDNEQRAEKEKEAGSLYSFKQHGEEPESDEQLIQRLTNDNFPSYHQEFSDLIQADTLGDSEVTERPEGKDGGDVDANISVSAQDMVAVSELHCDLVLALADIDWYKGKGRESLTTERQKAHTSLLNILHQVISTLKSDDISLTSVTSRLVHLHAISAGLMMGTCLGKSVSPSDKGSNVKTDYDIYRHENVAEAVRCMEPLSIVRLRLNELLEEWPDHPLLLQIVGVIDRIESFLVTEPLMKFTAGLELVLEKLQEWETNAARHVSVQAAMNAVSQLVIEWRKMELDGWKQSLDTVARRICLNSTKYWFHLGSVLLPLLDFIPPQETPALSRVVNTVIQFMESSALADFSYRLKLLQAYTIHLGVANHSQNVEILNSMHSIWQFYKQFEKPVSDYITKSRSGIEKELKNFVKISRWNDMNFWAVRASVDKAHKTLAKHMKAYHEILISPASRLFTEDVSQLPSVAEVSDDVTVSLLPSLTASRITSESTARDLLNMIADIKAEYPGREASFDLHCLPKILHLTKRFSSAVSTVESTLAKCRKKADIIQSFSVEIIETVTELQGLHIISGEDKEKQRKQARNIDMRKRKALAMLLQTLHKIGLSYRKGTRKLQKSEDRNEIMCARASPPLNLEIAFSQSDHGSFKHWLETWSSSINYMLRSITRRTVFLDASAKPSKELGADMISKLKGYSEHMIGLLRQHENTLTSHTLHWLSLREQVDGAQKAFDDTPGKLTHSSGPYQFALAIICDCPEFIEHVEELKLLLNCAPNKTASEDIDTPCTSNMLPEVSEITMYSDQWQAMVSTLDSCLATIHTFQQFVGDIGTRKAKLYTSSDIAEVEESVDHLLMAVKSVEGILSHFKARSAALKKDQYTLVSTIREAVLLFKSRVEAERYLISAKQPRLDTNKSPRGFVTEVDDLVKEMLLACQHTVTLLEESSPSNAAVDEEEGEVDYRSLVDGQLADSIKLFESVLKRASLEKISTKLKNLIFDTSVEPVDANLDRKALALYSSMPILHKFTNLTQEILTQSWSSLRNALKLLSILYNIFTHLASKGFCLPEELSDEMDGEGAGEFSTSEGTGLADGQGAKDVSDQIENEDDLDDAKRPEDREKEEEQPDTAPPQEDNAIEMSDDFGGAMEDAPATEVDEEDDNASSGDEDEMDDQMGDIGDSDLKEKLDEKLWGEDDPNDNDEQDETKDKEEEVGKGSEETKEDMVAKDENPEESVKDKGDKSEPPQADDPEKDKDLNELENKDQPEEEEYNQDEKPDPYFDGEKEKEAEGDDNNFELPEDLDLDDAEDKAGPDEAEEEPMDVDDNGDEDEGDDVEEKPGEGEEDTNADKPEEADDEKEEEPAIGELEPKDKPENEESEEQQQNVESYGASAQAADQQIIEQLAQDKGGETESKDEQGAGQAESASQKEAGLGESYQTAAADDKLPDQKNTQADGDKPSSDEKRSLGDTQNMCSNDLETIQSSTDKQPPAKQRQIQPPSNTLYEHITPDQQESADAQTMDAANEDQLEEQQKADQMETEQTDVPPPPEDETIKKEIEEVAQVKQLKPKELTEHQAINKRDKDADIAGENTDNVEPMVDEEEGEDDSPPEAGSAVTESTIHTDFEQLHLSQEEVNALKEDLESKVAEWGDKSEYEISEAEAREAWEKYDAVTQTLSHELCEQLRLILEPTQAAKLKGDYRTGKRLNMRKVIAYIASQFRKDSIWLRRTEPNKREYQIAVAVDDSSSMVDNHSKQLAFEALACISNALTYLQAGEMSIVSFGEDVKMVHDFSSRFTWDDGGNVLRNFSFNQKKTRIAHMLNTMSTKFLSLRRSGSTARHELAQLLMIVSDGRGLFLEGVDTVKQAVRRAMNSGIFLVFVIIDNPNSKDSILDIKMPVFSENGPPQIKSYMDSFPFPFYVILRDINSLPNTLGDALRQWFELVTSQT